VTLNPGSHGVSALLSTRISLAHPLLPLGLTSTSFCGTPVRPQLFVAHAASFRGAQIERQVGHPRLSMASPTRLFVARRRAVDAGHPPSPVPACSYSPVERNLLGAPRAAHSSTPPPAPRPPSWPTKATPARSGARPQPSRTTEPISRTAQHQTGGRFALAVTRRGSAAKSRSRSPGSSPPGSLLGFWLLHDRFGVLELVPPGLDIHLALLDRSREPRAGVGQLVAGPAELLDRTRVPLRSGDGSHRGQ
jgi:hypothetical protein